MNPSIQAITKLLTVQGQQQYGGEDINQLQHALQCATLAQSQGETPELVIACLLHDLGHLLHPLGDQTTTKNINDNHEYIGSCWLSSLFSQGVTEPIRLHVEAKRYLGIDSNYLAQLSWSSKHSLLLQGGVFSPEEATVFINKPFAKEAVKLRIFDDKAKIKDLVTPGLSSFLPIMEKFLN